jgi:beta-galactosidase
MNQRKTITMPLLAAVCLVLPSKIVMAETHQQHSRTQDLCFDWRFVKGDQAGAQQVHFDDSGWNGTQIPHDWSIEGPKDRKNPGQTKFGYFPGGIGWYRKHFRLSPNDEGKKIFIDFDGVYQNSEVWINGHSLGRRPYGFIGFQHDLTRYVKFDQDNVLAVRTDNSDQPNCRWYTGSGIYRAVRLTVTDKLHVKNCGTYVTTPRITKDDATVRVRTGVQNSYTKPTKCELVTTILDPNDKVVAERVAIYQIPAQDEHQFDQEIRVAEPELWSTDTPKIYRVATFLKKGGEVCDEYKTPFGIRRISFEKDKGFVLNGEQVKMKGVCIHQDAGSLGTAVPERAFERRLEILKSIGCNAIRTSHNPPSPGLLDLCDRMGFVVIDEAFDKWDAPYGRWFDVWWQMDLKDVIRRDRNHPCVVMWSVGNEVSDQGKPKFVEQLKALVDRTRDLDPTRPVTCALKPAKKVTSRETNAKTLTAIARMVDVLSCNYQEQWFEDYRKQYPEVVIIASESYPYYRGKNLNHKAFEPLNPWLEAVKHDYVAGTFYWTGIDYLGEAEAGWPCHGWNCGLIDTCGYVRPVAYLQKSFWTKEPMVHIAVIDKSLDEPEPTKDHWGWPKMDSHWNLPQLAGKKVTVTTFTNCSAVELLVNGTSMGTKNLEDFPDKMITWTVPYEPGNIEARGILQGQIYASHKLQTAGHPARIRLTADRDEIRADGRDLCYVDVQLTDKNGVLVPSAEHDIRFSVEGPGAIVGVDNGDLTSMESYKAKKRKAFLGRAQAIIQAARKPGTITLTAQTQGLPDMQVIVEAR